MSRSQSCCFLGIIITIYFFVFLHPLPNTFASPTRSVCLGDQRDALLELQKEFHVPTTSWNKSTDCCSWEGVTCDDILGKVISLELRYRKANTSLKSSSGLFKLQHLRELDLSFCNLKGKIPSSIGNLSHLTHLHLTYNLLVGEVPSSIGKLNQLEYMDLSYNDLKGNIPISFANFTKLSRLNLYENQFTGGLDIVLPNLTSSTSIQFYCNYFQSFSTDLSGLHNLFSLDGSNNSFVGPFPSSLFMISSLQFLDLSHNQFEGPIDFGNTSSSSMLKQLDLSHNNFGGSVPKSISKLGNLFSLDLSHNNFGGPVPRSISKLLKLDYINLSSNKLEGQVPHVSWRSPNSSEIFTEKCANFAHNSFSSFGESAKLGMLELLDISSNSLQGPIPQWICGIIFVLDLSNNHLSGSIPQCLSKSNNVILRNNSLSGSLPDLCIHDQQLQSLDVSHNNLVGKLPKSLIKCSDMRLLNVRGNKIKDTFPFWLGSLTYLTVLVLRSNAFCGPIYNASAYLGFPRLAIIDISNNNFVGSLPQDYFAKWPEMSLAWNTPESEKYLGDHFYRFHDDSITLVYKGVDMDFVKIFSGFKAIDFSGNQLSGNIPGSIGLLSDLRFLNLSGNAFTCNIPPSLANITKLETLDLSQNNLSGEIPQGLGKLTFLSYINFSHNHLQGLVPRSTQFGSQNCSSFMDNSGLYGLEYICGESNHVSVPTSSQQPDESLSEPEEPVLNWIAAAIAFGPGVFCGLVIGHIFTSYKHEWFIS
ncbi:hypothetical protein CARUB_v10016055mg [Capsella rubella]|uniref:Uncharacterized protein n=1 Tax=Capsella rubella TaxID=81985 RepID=R0I434_9BRAS|nr:receptor like protein 30 [Capsella rubella]EOA32750.1 hypothetical protein CARUB_v10016055mg [Capsella rubella]